jgi:RHS repeat-associated protein
MDATGETFTMDDLGNRDSAGLRDGNNVDYAIDNLTNRYHSVDGNGLIYDAAGNLTRDKDGYQYQYDYENRIIKITRDGNDIAGYAYDSLGRRILKSDYKTTSNSRYYYYNYNWQILDEYVVTTVLNQEYVYGNYIDEVLYKKYFPPIGYNKYFLHDHLYSVVAIASTSGDVNERYEYDAYGTPTIWDAGFTTKKSSPGFFNTYLFTGRQVDILNSGSLKIQYNRNRFYDYSTGRWLTLDPFGITPNAPKPNVFDKSIQYTSGLNLYEYVMSDPILRMDPKGLMSDLQFFMEFVSHYMTAEGKVFTIGDDVVKRQSGVKDPVGNTLIHLSTGYCEKAMGSPNKTAMGSVDETVYAVAQDSWYLLSTLNTPYYYYKITGTYEARQVCSAVSPVCTKCVVNLSLEHVWLDKGKLDLAKWADKFLWLFIHLDPGYYIGKDYQEFPIRIGWPASNMLKKENPANQFKVATGWPFD